MTTITRILLTGVLSLASVAFVNAKTHQIILGEPAMAGNVQLPAGQYSLKVEGESAIFTQLDKDRVFTTPVKQETGTEKYDQTAVKTNSEGGATKITEIDLGGSHIKLEFMK